MFFEKTNFEGLLVVTGDRKFDNRGFFCRTFCVNEFKLAGIECKFVQDSMSFNRYANTIRGMHFQYSPYMESKLVSCVNGKILDVAVDLRKESTTYLKCFSIELSSDNAKAVFIPEGFAHGFQTLESNCLINYKISQFYTPNVYGGIRYDDPKLDIKWINLEPHLIISDQDKEWELI